MQADRESVLLPPSAAWCASLDMPVAALDGCANDAQSNSAWLVKWPIDPHQRCRMTSAISMPKGAENQM
jgi:hypothetical protein